MSDTVDVPNTEDQLGEAAPVSAEPSASEPTSGQEVNDSAVVEALLFASDGSLQAAKIAEIIGRGTARDVKGHIAALNAAYEREGRVFRIEEIAGGYQMLSMPVYRPWVSRLLNARQENRLSPAAMETLAIVAYKQPVLRADIEAIRGVSCGELLNRLRELNLIKIVGRAEDLGRPILYGTTRRFLEVFGLGSLDDLPSAEELSPPEPA